MCGIAGLFSVAPLAALEVSRIAAMTASLAHRGPDGSGTAGFTHAALGHARLAIIDLEGGRQPMSVRGGRYTITYNGEIYNYRELRADLQRAGQVFATQSDTEVILALFAAEGAAGLARMRGMYAFAIWDEHMQSGVLARDPLGIKPLFYRDEPGATLRFGSEAKAILAGEGRGAVLDTAALHLLMNFRYLPGEHTLFRGIRQLAPGAVLTWRAGGVRIETLPPPMPPAAAAADLEVLGDSVAAHLTADVEVACYLSGGIDSAAITALAARGGRAIRTFTLPIGDDPAEAANATRTAALLGVANLRGDPPSLRAEDFSDLVWHLETPKVNAMQSALLARHAARHVSVVLSGLGGDEVFYGYNFHAILDRMELCGRFVPDSAARGCGGWLARTIRAAVTVPWTEAERFALMIASAGNWPRIYGLLRNLWDTPALRARIYGPRLLESDLPDAFEVVAAAWPSNADPVAAAAAYEWGGKMVNDLLWHEDRVSMAVGLEVRVPFVDRVVRAHFGLRSRAALMAGGTQKAHLRRMLAGVLPAEITTRPKSGFQVHAPRFFREHLAELAAVYLSPECCRRHGLFNPAFVTATLRLPPRTRWRWHYFMLYLMLLTHLWLERFAAPGSG